MEYFTLFLYTLIKEKTRGDTLSISSYIKNHEKLKEMDFLTVYNTIIELIVDGHMEWQNYV